jgi:hypothetical protein
VPAVPPLAVQAGGTADLQLIKNVDQPVAASVAQSLGTASFRT